MPTANCQRKTSRMT